MIPLGVLTQQILSQAPAYEVVGTVIMQTAVAVNDVPGSPITLTNLGPVTTNTDGFAPGRDSFVFTRADAQGIGIDDHADLDIGTADYTVECWIKTTMADIASQAASFWANDRLAGNSGGNPRMMVCAQDGALDYFNGTYRLNGTTDLSDGIWHHLAHTRLDGINRIWVNGIQEAATYNNPVDLSTDGMGIFDWSTNGCIDGEVAMWRLTIGEALYTGAFTPPTDLLA
jgi:hypothetical protein